MAETYYSIKLSTLTDIGNAIRAKSGATGDIEVTNLATSILDLSPAATDSPLPIEVSTEAEMTALLESGEIGGVYKYTGTTGTYENGALYVLEEEDELVGTWVFNEDIVTDGGDYSMEFQSNGNSYTSMNNQMYDGMLSLYYDNTLAYDSDGERWANSAFRTITITTPLNEVVPSTGYTLEDLMSFMTSNAIKQ